MNKTQMVWGIVLLVVGSLLLLAALGVPALSIAAWWPVGLTFLSLYFHWSALLKPGERPKELLVPGGILLVYSLLLLWCSLMGWSTMNTLWPIFLLGPALGMLELYLLGGRKRGLLVPSCILVLLALCFLMQQLIPGAEKYVVPLLLIVGGVLMLIPHGKQEKKQ